MVPSHKPAIIHQSIPPIVLSLGYILDWSTSTSCRRTIADLNELTSELQRHVPTERLLVIKSPRTEVLEVLKDVGNLDTGILEGHCWRGRNIGRTKGGRFWSWEYPDGLIFNRVSLWYSTHIPILLLNSRHTSRILPSLQHQDSVTTASGLRSEKRALPNPANAESIEVGIWDSLGDDEPLKEVLVDVVYQGWLAFLDNLDIRCGQPLLWAALKALERNQDHSRLLDKQSRQLSVSHTDWKDFISRIRLRLLLTQSPPQTSDIPKDTSRGIFNEDQQRTLDRITYLGGLLLPITLVSGVLAIEGDYGPEGGNFWVFWVASVVAAAVTILIVHIDKLSSLQVWVEVAAEAALASDMNPFGTLALKENGRTWEKRTLGWGGAVKKVSGYYRVRGCQGVRFEEPDR